MDFEHVNVKLYVDGDESALEPLVPIFHRWIVEKPFEELLLDVADYRHVHAGPGVVLIGHQANYSVDNTNNELGVLYNRKTMFDGSNQDRFRQATLAALTACRKLEAEAKLGGKLRFGQKCIEVVVNDRLLAPNAPETRAEFEPELKAFCTKLFGGDKYSASYEEDPRKRFGVTLRTERLIPVNRLLANLGS